MQKSKMANNDIVPIIDNESLAEDDEEEECIESRRVQRNCFHPDSVLMKSLALSLMCTLGFGSYFCYDNPGALQDEFKSAMSISTYQFEKLYALYSWPNVVLPIIGGYLLDNVFGIRLGAVLFSGFILAGKKILFLSHFWRMIISQAINLS